MFKNLAYKLFFLAGLSISSLCLSANSADSLKRLLNSSIPDSTRLSVLNKLATKNIEINTDSGMYYSGLAIELATRLRNKKGLIKATSNLGDQYRVKKEYIKSASYFREALKMAEELNDKKEIARMYAYLGIVHIDTKNYVQAVDYYKRSISNCVASHDSILLQKDYQNMTVIYYYLKDFTNAIDYVDKGYELSRRMKDSCTMNELLNNKADMQLAQKQPRAALNSLFAALKIQGSCKDKERNILPILYLNIAYCYDSLDATDSAIIYFNRSIPIAYTDNQLVYIEGCYSLAKDYAKKHEYALAYDNLIRSYAIRDTVQGQQSAMQTQALQALYENEKKDKEIALLNKENEKQQILLFSVIGGAILLIILSLIIYSRYRLKKKANAALTNAYSLIEEKNMQIVDSIEYAKKIQDSILPKESLIKTFFPESFILFLPKNIVSGDFYWFSHRGSRSIIVSADCSGHGVPGAFMSMIGNILLNEIINELGVFKPAKILNLLREGLLKALHNNIDEDIKDGIALSLLVIDKDNKKLIAATAGQPIYIVHDNKLEEIQNTSRPIGEYTGEFTEQEFEYIPGAYIFMSTDGFQDQKGGPLKKRFLRQNLKDMLLRNSARSATEQQQQLDATFKEWKQDLEQTDDVLVMGLKL